MEQKNTAVLLTDFYIFSIKAEVGGPWPKMTETQSKCYLLQDIYKPQF
jgi:hypothetical protein